MRWDVSMSPMTAQTQHEKPLQRVGARIAGIAFHRQIIKAQVVADY